MINKSNGKTAAATKREQLCSGREWQRTTRSSRKKLSDEKTFGTNDEKQKQSRKKQILFTKKGQLQKSSNNNFVFFSVDLVRLAAYEFMYGINASERALSIHNA